MTTTKRAYIKRHAPADPKSVYFIRAVGLGVIKIGYAIDWQSRFRSIATCCPVPVEMVGRISSHDAMAIEKDWHRRFGKLRAQGEWFTETPELLEAIAAANAQPRADDDARREAIRATYSAPFTNAAT